MSLEDVLKKKSGKEENDATAFLVRCGAKKPDTSWSRFGLLSLFAFRLHRIGNFFMGFMSATHILRLRIVAHLIWVKVVTYHVPPNRYIFLPITMHDCRRRAFGETPRVTTRCQTFFTGSKQCRSLKWRSRSPLYPPKM